MNITEIEQDGTFDLSDDHTYRPEFRDAIIGVKDHPYAGTKVVYEFSELLRLMQMLQPECDAIEIIHDLVVDHCYEIINTRPLRGNSY